MFRIDLIHYTNMIVFRLQGKLAGDAVEELRSAWVEARPAGNAEEFVDLEEVTSVDAAGLHLLNVMYLAGVRFVASSPYTIALLEELDGAIVESLPEDREIRRISMLPLAAAAAAAAGFRSGSRF